MLSWVLNPFQTNFSVFQKTLYGKTKNLLKTGFVIETKYLKIVHGTVVNVVQGRMSLFTGGKSGKFQFDCDGCILFTRRSINITNSFSFSLYNLPFFILFFAAELSIILQRLILLHRSLRFNDRNSIIDCNFGNTWRVFGVQIIDKVARTLFHSLLLFLLR